MTRDIEEIQVAEQTFRLLGAGALLWPAQKMLVVADLHLGKAETFGQNGLPLPAEAQLEDLRRLTQLMEIHQPRELVFLGDLVHSRGGVTSSLEEHFARWISQFSGQIWLVAGNHDRATIRHWPHTWSTVQIIPELARSGFCFRHEPPHESDSSRNLFTWAGHLHPCVRLHSRADSLRLKAFVVGQTSGILPAFSSLAGGYDVTPGPGRRLYPIAEGQVFAAIELPRSGVAPSTAP